jgi:ribosomal protein S18 acetylase RimI-like enzyme
VALAFRLATIDDVSTLDALVQSAFRGDASRVGWTTEADLLDGQRTDAEALTDLVRRDALFVAEDGGEIVACCQLEAEGYLGMLSVRPGLQGTGIGRAVVAEAERRCDAPRMRMTVIRHRTELIAWYERRGYRRTGETAAFPYGDERFGIPKVDDLEFVVLEKQLA